jgi:hypothetical protein
MLLKMKENKAHSIVGTDWLDIVSRTTPCIDCLAFFDQKATGQDLTIWRDELESRNTYIRKERGFDK